ncbi:MAG TPA: TolC family protein [Acidiferrobacteraceae bacterium]|nr:TolC family protein [Acidiferrobacteraceae bacterium]
MRVIQCIVSTNLLLLLIGPFALASQDRESCYTVQLNVWPDHDQADAFLNKHHLGKDCVVLPVAKQYSVQCGMSATYVAAAETLTRYHSIAPSAYVSAIRKKSLALIYAKANKGTGCDKESSAVDAVLFPDSLLTEPIDSKQAVSALLQKTETIREKYLRELGNQGSFKGFYLRGQWEKDQDSGESQDTLALEWELFDEGWRESKQLLDKKKLETQLQFFQMLKDMHEHRLNERLYHQSGIENSVRLHLAKTRLIELSSLLKRYKQRRDNGYVTEAETQQLEYQVDRAKMEISQYSNMQQEGMSMLQFDLLNTIEHISTVDQPSLLKIGIRQSIDLKIQDIFIQRAEFFPAWTDDLSVRLYLGNRRLYGGQRRDNLIGARIRFPLDLNLKRRKLIKIEQNAYRDQKAALTLRIEQKIVRLLDQFRFQQKRVHNLNGEHALLQKRLALLGMQVKYPLAELATVPEKEIDQINMQMLLNLEEVLMARLATYDKLLKLSALIMTENLRSLVRD